MRNVLHREEYRVLEAHGRMNGLPDERGMYGDQ
jgi:hypothetical protein